jgi:hypothetical protein
VDLDAGEITVHDDRAGVGGPACNKAGDKTRNADQTIALDNATIGVLRAWRDRQDREREFFRSDYRPGDYVFTVEQGQRLNRGRNASERADRGTAPVELLRQAGVGGKSARAAAAALDGMGG